MAKGRVIRIKYGCRDIGFTGARLDEAASFGPGWQLCVQSPENLDEFRDDLAQAKSIALSLFAVDGRWCAGQAVVAFISEDPHFPVVTLTGQGPLRRA